MGLRVPPWYMSLTFLIIIGGAAIDASGTKRLVFTSLVIAWLAAYVAVFALVKLRARRRDGVGH